MASSEFGEGVGGPFLLGQEGCSCPDRDGERTSVLHPLTVFVPLQLLWPPVSRSFLFSALQAP